MVQPEELSLYIHWPFCLAKCPYCDFNSHVREAVDQARWRRALLAELRHFAGQTAGRRLVSIFFGGGTPSLMEGETVAALIAAARHHWHCDGDLEVTLEANPTSVESERFAAYRQGGVNRLSLGVQSLDDEALRFLGRQHSSAEALNALAVARRHFGRISFDLIYARPGQSWLSWKSELDRALQEGPGHISLYQLTIEENTVFHGARRRGELVELEEETASELFLRTRQHLADQGLLAYEVSNHARPGEACRHNLVYWRQGDYVGVGPGAHGRLTLAGQRHATRQHRAPEAWLKAVESDGHATRALEVVLPGDALKERVMMALRTQEGLQPRADERNLIDPLEGPRLEALINEGYLLRKDQGLVASEEGLMRLNAVIAHLLAEVA